MKLQEVINQLASAPPTQACASIMQAYSKVLTSNPPPPTFTQNTVNTLSSLYTGNPYGLAVAYAVSVLHGNGIAQNIAPNNVEVINKIIQPTAQAGYNMPNTGTGYNIPNTYSEMEFGEDPAKQNTVKNKYLDDSIYDDEPAPEPVIVKPTAPTVDPNKIYTLEELLQADFNLIPNCIYINVDDYKSRVNLTVPVNMDSWLDEDPDSTTKYIKDPFIHVFNDLDIKGYKAVGAVLGSSTNRSKELDRLLNKKIKSEDDVLYIRHLLFANNIYNELINLTLRMCGSGIIIDNGLLDYEDLIDAIEDNDHMVSAIKSLVRSLSAGLGDEQIVDKSKDYYAHKLDTLSIQEKAVDMCLLVATQPMILDKVVHKNLITDLEDMISDEYYPVLIRLIDADLLAMHTGDGIVVCNIDCWIP